MHAHWFFQFLRPCNLMFAIGLESAVRQALMNAGSLVRRDFGGGIGLLENLTGNNPLAAIIRADAGVIAGLSTQHITIGQTNTKSLVHLASISDCDLTIGAKSSRQQPT